MSCGLSTRQRRLYHGLRQRISVDDLLQSSTSQTSSKDSATSHLLNLVMQFRKVRVYIFLISTERLSSVHIKKVHVMILCCFYDTEYYGSSLVPRPIPAFQCCTLKSGKAWYHKSREIREN